MNHGNVLSLKSPSDKVTITDATFENEEVEPGSTYFDISQAKIVNLTNFSFKNFKVRSEGSSPTLMYLSKDNSD